MERTVFLLLILFLSKISFAQVLKNYSFTETSTYYETITGPYDFDDTLFNSAYDDKDDGNVLLDLENIFNFKFCGQEYHEFLIDANGFLGFGDVSCYDTYNNRLKGDIYPIAAPLWDDLIVKDNVYYKLEDDYQHYGKKILTFEWSGLYYDDCLDTFSVQVKLYEATGVIEFIYNDMASAYYQSEMSASIGLNYYDQDLDTLEIISISPSSSSTTYSRVSPNDTITEIALSDILDGTVYRFTPAPTNLKLNDITSPLAGDLDNDSINIKVEVKNVGFDTVGNFAVRVWVIDTLDKKVLLDRHYPLKCVKIILVKYCS